MLSIFMGLMVQALKPDKFCSMSLESKQLLNGALLITSKCFYLRVRLVNIRLIPTGFTCGLEVVSC